MGRAAGQEGRKKGRDLRWAGRLFHTQEGVLSPAAPALCHTCLGDSMTMPPLFFPRVPRLPATPPLPSAWTGSRAGRRARATRRRGEQAGRAWRAGVGVAWRAGGRMGVWRIWYRHKFLLNAFDLARRWLALPEHRHHSHIASKRRDVGEP